MDNILEQEVRNYLKGMKEFLSNTNLGQAKLRYICQEDFILQNGRFYKATPRPLHTKQMTMKGCYANAYHLTVTNSNLQYCEGIGQGKGLFPMCHAWCITESGQVIDPTWKKADWYFGVTFPIEYVEHILFQKETYGVLDSFELKWPLLTGEHTYNKTTHTVDLHSNNSHSGDWIREAYNSLRDKKKQNYYIFKIKNIGLDENTANNILSFIFKQKIKVNLGHKQLEKFLNLIATIRYRFFIILLLKCGWLGTGQNRSFKETGIMLQRTTDHIRQTSETIFRVLKHPNHLAEIETITGDVLISTEMSPK